MSYIISYLKDNKNSKTSELLLQKNILIITIIFVQMQIYVVQYIKGQISLFKTPIENDFAFNLEIYFE